MKTLICYQIMIMTINNRKAEQLSGWVAGFLGQNRFEACLILNIPLTLSLKAVNLSRQKSYTPILKLTIGSLQKKMPNMKTR